MDTKCTLEVCADRASATNALALSRWNSITAVINKGFSLCFSVSGSSSFLCWCDTKCNLRGCMQLQGENELEEELLDQVQSCLGAVLEKFGDSAMPLMEGLMPQIGTLLTPKSSIEERRVGICVMDDIMEHTKEGVAVACNCDVMSLYFLKLAVPCCICRFLVASKLPAPSVIIAWLSAERVDSLTSLTWMQGASASTGSISQISE